MNETMKYAKLIIGANCNAVVNVSAYNQLLYDNDVYAARMAWRQQPLCMASMFLHNTVQIWVHTKYKL